MTRQNGRFRFFLKFYHPLACFLTIMVFPLFFSTPLLASTANILLDQNSGVAPLEVSLTCTTSKTSATVLRFVIDFGDGESETAETHQSTHVFKHTYGPGLFKPYFTVYKTLGITKASDPATLILAKWRFETGDEVDSSPAIGTNDDGSHTIYIGSDDKNFYAIDPNTGLELWHYTTGDAISASPAIGPDGTIYIGSQDGLLYAFKPDRPNAPLKWFLNIGAPIFSSPAINTDGTLYIGTGEPDNNLCSITPSGVNRWSYTTGGSIVSSPSIGFDGLEDILYFGSTDKHVYAIAADNGRLKWSFKTDAAVYGSPAIASDGRIYIGECETGHAYDYHFKFFCLNIDGTKHWDMDTGAGVYGSPAIGADNNVYFGSWDGIFYSVSLAGEYRWSVNAYRSFNSSPAVGDNGLVYVGCKNNSFYCLIDPSTIDKYNKEDQKKRKDWTFATGKSIGLSSPAIGDDGTIYFGSRDGYVYAVNPGELAPDSGSWPMFRKNTTHEGRAEGIVISDVISTDPAKNAADIEPTVTQISVKFSPEMTTPSDIDANSFSVKHGSNTLSGYAVTNWGQNSNHLIVTFSINNEETPLVYGTTYSASIGYTDTEGTAKTFSWNFSTIEEPETDPNPSPSPSFCFIGATMR